MSNVFSGEPKAPDSLIAIQSQNHGQEGVRAEYEHRFPAWSTTEPCWRAFAAFGGAYTAVYGVYLRLLIAVELSIAELSAIYVDLLH